MKTDNFIWSPFLVIFSQDLDADNSMETKITKVHEETTDDN